MKNKFLIACIFTLSGISVKCQNTSKEHLDSLVNNFVTELRTKGIDTICIFEDYFTHGQAFIGAKSDWCDTKSQYLPVYFLWRQNNKTYLSKKDNCFDF